MRCFDVHMDADKPIIIYGTGVCAKIIYYGLKQQGIDVYGFADKNPKECYMGCPVLNLEQLKEYMAEQHPILILGITKALKIVVKQLEQLGIREYYNGYSVLERAQLPIEENSQEIVNFYKMRWLYQYYLDELDNPNSLYLESLDVVVSERCSLRCRDCSNLMQYYQKPVNVKIDEMKEQLERFFSCVGCIAELRILGGEPFMCPDFYKLIQWYRDDDRFLRIGIYSNATIFPKEEVLEYLKHEKIILHFSDYGELSRKLKQWIAFCEENNVAYVITRMTEWHDCGKLEKRMYSEQQMKAIYQTCECRELPTFLHGRLYNCPYAAHAANLGAMENTEAEKDYLSFETEESYYTVEGIKNFLYEREYLEACNYCSGRNYSLKAIPPHIQTKVPLPYERKHIDYDNH